MIFLLIVFMPLNFHKEAKNSKDPHRYFLPQANLSQKTDFKAIAEKLKPKNSTIVHDVIATDLWNAKNVIIAFYETRYVDNDKRHRQFVECYLLIPHAKDKYEKILVHEFQDDNVDTKIESVFFANADEDREKELIIISTCKHRLPYLYDGTEHMTDIFDNTDLSRKNSKKSLKKLSNMSEKLTGGFEGFRDGDPNAKAKFKNAFEVKSELKRLGF